MWREFPMNVNGTGIKRIVAIFLLSKLKGWTKFRMIELSDWFFKRSRKRSNHLVAALNVLDLLPAERTAAPALVESLSRRETVVAGTPGRHQHGERLVDLSNSYLSPTVLQSSPSKLTSTVESSPCLRPGLPTQVAVPENLERIISSNTSKLL